MLLNLTDILSNEGKVEDFSVTYSPAFYKKAGGQFKVLEDGPISLKLSNTGKGKLQLSGEGRLLLQARCDRCLTRVDIPISISLSFFNLFLLFIMQIIDIQIFVLIFVMKHFLEKFV